jgi:hypothetical protein
MGILRTAAGGAKKWTWWGRVVAAAEVALVAKRHLDLLAPGEVGELRRLLVKSKGRPDNLTARERKRIQELVKKLQPGMFAKDATARFVPFAGRKKT